MISTGARASRSRRCGGWPTRSPRRRASLGRHGDLLGYPDPGQRARGQRDDRPDLPDRRQVITAPTPRSCPGHGWQEELKLMLNLTKPRYVSRSTATTSACACTPSWQSPSESIGIGSSAGETALRSRWTRAPGSARTPRRHDLRGRRRRSATRGVRARDRRSSPPTALHRRRDDLVRRRAQVRRPEVIFRGVPFAEEADGLVEELREWSRTPFARPPRRRSGRSRCSSRTFTTTSRSSSTSSCAAARWSSRSSSRSENRVANRHAS